MIATLATPQDRRLARAYTTWRVLRRLRRGAAQRPRPRTYTAHAHVRLRAAVDFLTWLAAQNLTLADCRQSDLDLWLQAGPAAGNVRDFLLWAAEHKHCPALHVAPPPRNNGAATAPEQRWEQIRRLLHDETIDLTDRVAGCLLLLYGQQLSRIAAMTTDQITDHHGTVSVRLGRDEIDLPDKLGQAMLAGRPYTGVGSPASRWLQRLPPRRAFTQARYRRPARPPLDHDPPCRPRARRRPRRPAQPRPDHGRALDAPGRGRLDAIRRRTGPRRRSPTMTNTTQARAGPSIRHVPKNALYQFRDGSHASRPYGPHGPRHDPGGFDLPAQVGRT
jgi:hypothetical protein